MPLLLNDRYVPIQELGAGGFGRTFLVRDLASNNETLEEKEQTFEEKEQLVIKQLHSARPLSEFELRKAQELFQREKVHSNGSSIFKFLSFRPSSVSFSPTADTPHCCNRDYFIWCSNILRVTISPQTCKIASELDNAFLNSISDIC
jgi:serine/threonine protein kinase